MRQLLMLAAVAGLAVAKPETYREKEDFQFSRSSTDEGTKSGYYGAQKGNMGGNYERAHNMDSLAQNQMSGLVRSVESELGDGVKQHTGSVHTAATSSGMFGSGAHDLSNLAGRNFQEGEHSSSSSASHNSAYKNQHSSSNIAGYSNARKLNAGFDSTRAHDGGYASTLSQNGGYDASSNSHSRGSGYRRYNEAANSDQAILYSHQGSNLQSANQYEDRNAASHNFGQYTGGYQGQVYDQDSSLSHGSNIHSRLIAGNPLKIVIRPGTRVTVPVAAQTYDASQSSSSFDQNAINTGEILNGNDQDVIISKPQVKKYESSYRYNKEWEKHDTIPVRGVPVAAVPLAIPTVNPYPVNSELYEDAQALEQQRLSEVSSQRHHHHSSHSGYNVNSASTNQYNTHQNTGLRSGSNAYNGAYIGNKGANGASGALGATGASGAAGASGASGASADYNHGAYIGVNNGASNLNLVDDESSKPKSYQSSYSYHKSWERQGDPYVILPTTNGDYEQTSGKLIAGSNQETYGTSHQYGSHSNHHSHQGYIKHSDDDCDENGHFRKARSYKSEDFGQQAQNTREQFRQYGEDLQQTQKEREELSQQSEDLGQQAQSSWVTLQYGQETQKQNDNLEDLGQQTQNTWDILELEPQSQTDLGQQIQDSWTEQETSSGDNNDQLMEQKPSALDASSRLNSGMNFDHQANDNTFDILTQQVEQSNNHQKHITQSHTLENENTNITHHIHTIWDEIKKEEIGQENEDSVEDLSQTANLGQQTLVKWDNINQKENGQLHQETVYKAHDLTNSEPKRQENSLVMPNPHPWMYNQVYHHHNDSTSTNQHFGHHSSSSHSHSESQSQSHNLQQHFTNMDMDSDYSSNGHTQQSGSTFGSSITSLWDKLDNIEKHTMSSHETDQQKHIVDTLGNQNQHTETTYTANDSQDKHNLFEILTRPIQDNPSQIKSTTAIPTTTTKDKAQPSDMGRGDIEPENLGIYKTSEEIDSLSLTKETNKTHNKNDRLNHKSEDDRDLTVMSLEQQKSEQDKEKHVSVQSNSNVKVTTQRNNINHAVEENHQQEQQFENQALSNQFEFGQETEHQNTGQQVVDFGQNFNQMESQSNGQRFHQENVEAVDNKNEHFDQVSLSGWKPDESFSQRENKGDENMEQQSQTGWIEGMEEQQVQPAWKPNEDLQQHSQLTEPLSQQMEDLSQQVQKISLGDTFHQGNNKHETEDLSQQNKHFDQVSGFEPVEIQQESQHDQWGQGKNLEQQSQSGWTENMNDQQIQSTWNTEDLQQHSQLNDKFTESMENLDQQVQTGWKPTEDLQQQSKLTDTFTQMEQTVPPTANHKSEVSEELIVPKKVETVDSPPEVTEKPSFWKSVGNKFTNAKDKVSSWFSSS